MGKISAFILSVFACCINLALYVPGYFLIDTQDNVVYRLVSVYRSAYYNFDCMGNMMVFDTPLSVDIESRTRFVMMTCFMTTTIFNIALVLLSFFSTPVHVFVLTLTITLYAATLAYYIVKILPDYGIGTGMIFWLIAFMLVIWAFMITPKTTKSNRRQDEEEKAATAAAAATNPTPTATAVKETEPQPAKPKVEKKPEPEAKPEPEKKPEPENKPEPEDKSESEKKQEPENPKPDAEAK